ncbi:hypothetical protein ABT173_23360 [Streptomyces sp. NPDC001795]|uniref:hypothetical protein n=1 Tax=unclassified Streptomyces TaxID=2593676 RepID=UPI003329FC44
MDELAAFRTRAPGMPYAHPTVDRCFPLFVTPGAAARVQRPVETVIDGCMTGFSERSLQTAGCGRAPRRGPRAQRAALLSFVFQVP